MLSNNLHKLRKQCGLTLEEVAEKIGTSKQTIHRYENGVISNVPADKVEALARVFGTTPSELMGWKTDTFPYSFPNIKPITTKRLPILGRIACGKPIYAEEEHESYIMSGAAPDADFCLRAVGDSMVGARIYDGDIVFIRSQESVDNGEIAAVVIDDEATLKRVYFYPEKEKLILSPENPHYEPLVFLGKELDHIKIIGKAVAFQSLIR